MTGGQISWKVWAPGLLLLAVMLAGVVGNLLQGNYVALGLLVAALLAAVAMFYASRFRARLLFRAKTPEGAIVHYHNLVRRLPHADAAAAYLSAMAAAAYADFARARQELDAVKWTEKPALYRSQHLYALALLALMEDQDPPRALELARAGRAIEAEIPGGGVQVVFDVVETAAGSENAAGIERLERTAKGRSGLIPALCLWALALCYQRSGNAAEAARCGALLRSIAPNCKSLVR